MVGTACSPLFEIDEVIMEDAAYKYVLLGVDTGLPVVLGTGMATDHMLIYYNLYEYRERYRIAGPGEAEDLLIDLGNECGVE